MSPCSRANEMHVHCMRDEIHSLALVWEASRTSLLPSSILGPLVRTKPNSVNITLNASTRLRVWESGIPLMLYPQAKLHAACSYDPGRRERGNFACTVPPLVPQTCDKVLREMRNSAGKCASLVEQSPILLCSFAFLAVVCPEGREQWCTVLYRE